MYCATPELLNTNAYCLICLAAKLVGWVGTCAGMISWVCKLVDRVRLGEKKCPVSVSGRNMFCTSGFMDDMFAQNRPHIRDPTRT